MSLNLWMQKSMNAEKNFPNRFFPKQFWLFKISEKTYLQIFLLDTRNELVNNFQQNTFIFIFQEALAKPFLLLSYKTKPCWRQYPLHQTKPQFQRSLLPSLPASQKLDKSVPHLLAVKKRPTVRKYQRSQQPQSFSRTSRRIWAHSVQVICLAIALLLLPQRTTKWPVAAKQQLCNVFHPVRLYSPVLPVVRWDCRTETVLCTYNSWPVAEVPRRSYRHRW